MRMKGSSTRAQKPNGGESGAGFRELPAVASLLDEVKRAGVSTLDDPTLTRAIQERLATERDRIASGDSRTRDAIIQTVIEEIAALERPRLAPVINATGVIIHTNLGRAPVSAATAAAMAAVASGYVPLEIDAATNQRGGRMDEISTLMRLLTRAERTLVVNNNAAAVLLTLSAIAAGRSVIVSRGEAVEIGGGFRIPDVLRQSGARLVEVGTTNRTYVDDYAAAIDEETAALFKVHTSNFAITGFVHSASVGELAELARTPAVPVIEDLGSGALLETAQFGLAAEPTIGESLRAGASVITASGDKLLGGPQAGLIAGQRTWVDRIARHPLARAMRADKTCLAGIAATLRHYARGEAERTIPIWRMIAASPDDLHRRGDHLAAALRRDGIDVMVEPTEATVGGGSLPGQVLPSWALAFHTPTIDDLARRLRTGAPAVFGHIDSDRLLLDLRTVLPEQDNGLITAIRAAITPS
jgi:L-seryl-tRNA(Ser) seleniumtransferase